MEILRLLVEIYNYDTPAKGSSNLTPFDIRSKSGDGECSEDIVL